MFPVLSIPSMMKALIFTAVITVLYLGFNHYTGVIDANAAMQVEASTLKANIADANARARLGEMNANSARDAARTAANRVKEVEKDVQETFRTLAEHDLNFLLQQKPGLIGGVVNRGTDRVFKQLEDAANYTNGGHTGRMPGPADTTPSDNAQGAVDPDKGGQRATVAGSGWRGLRIVGRKYQGPTRFA